MAPFAGVYLPRQNLQNLKINIKHFYILCYLVHVQLSVLVEMHVIIKLHKFTKLSQHFHEKINTGIYNGMSPVPTRNDNYVLVSLTALKCYSQSS